MCVVGGLKGNDGGGYGLERHEVDAVAFAVRKLPIEERFAAAPEYNHPLVFCGRKLAMGYNGHLYSQGVGLHAIGSEPALLMLGQPEWGQCASKLRVRYLYWGAREEQAMRVPQNPGRRCASGWRPDSGEASMICSSRPAAVVLVSSG